MSVRVAVASSDGKFINQHFGHAKLFIIFELNEDGKFEFLEIRKNVPSCNGGDHTLSALDATLDLIKDTDIVLVSQIGPGALQFLLSSGIKPYIMPTYIDEALENLANKLTETG
jgi:predicted Fe-Mo cluster-binding NifX family protein